MDTIDPQAKIPPPISETRIAQKTEEKEPQPEQRYLGKKKKSPSPDTNPEEPETNEKHRIDIRV